MATLVVQMGHVGRTSGATGAPGEQAFTTAVGDACRKILNGVNGWSIRLVPADPVLSEYRGDGFVAIHADGSSNPAVRGASYGYQTSEGSQTGQAWYSSWRRVYGGPWNSPNYTVNLAQYYGIRNAVSQGNKRAFILEAGTITNSIDREWITSANGLTALAHSIGVAFGIMSEDTMDEASIAAGVWDGANLDGKTAREWLKTPGVSVWDGSVLDGMTARERLEKTNADLVQVKQQLAEIKSLITQGFTLKPNGEITVTAEPIA